MQSLKKWIFLALIVGVICTKPLQAQIIEYRHDTLESMALVLDMEPSNYFNIPEIKFDPNGDDDFLKIDFHVKYAKYKIGRDSVKMRSYVYDMPFMPSGVEQLSEGPTIRIQRNDRLAVTVHNDLPLNGDRNYLGSMNKGLATDLDLDTLTEKIIDAMVAASKNRYNGNWIKKDNFKYESSMKVVTEKEEWEVNGHVICECSEGQEGTCEKVPITYNIYKMWNMGKNGNGGEALRIYTDHVHDESNHNEPHGFNVTNFHTHGFHVSPFQDDILRSLDPGYSTYYTYDLKDHTPGTMWYHPHIHGSTALQVASGMSGVIIIEDDPEVLAKFPALRDASLPEHEKVMVFNQLMYDQVTGELPDFNTMMYTIKKDPPSGTTINGVVKPVIDIEIGEVQRWRMLHSGYSTNLGLYYGDSIEVKQMAVDGITFKETRSIKSSHFSPGNRMDVLIKVADNFPGKSGDSIPIYSHYYFPECEYFPESDHCLKKSENYDNKTKPVIIAYLRVGKNPMEPAMTFPTKLPGPGVGHEDIQPDKLVNPDNPRNTTFNIFEVTPPTDPKSFNYAVNGKVYNGDSISEKPLMGTREAWTFKAEKFEHPFHIHINPFQIIEFGGVELETPMWKDVALVREWRNGKYGSWGQAKLGPIKVRQGTKVETLTNGNALSYTYYQKYWGGFVLHCHILDHEDRGMMQRVNIVKDIDDSDLTQKQKERAERIGYK